MEQQKMTLRQADRAVMDALYRVAVGGSYEEELWERRREPPDDRLILVRRAVKQVPPNLPAAQFWLKNRHPNQWRDKPAAPEEKGELLQVEIDGPEQWRK